MVFFTLIVGILWYINWKWNVIDVITQYDKILHFIAGFTCGIFGIFLLAQERDEPWRINRNILIAALKWALIIGLAWEFWEFVTPWTRDFGPWNFWDTFFDVVFDCLGATLAYRAYRDDEPE